ncbi:MAG: glycyl radical protein [Promethearchaeota archaeon]
MVLTSERIQNSTRTEKLLDNSLSRKYQICVERAKLITESYKMTESHPPIIRNARALEKVLSEMPIFIQDGELIVGNRTSKTLGAPLFPEIYVNWMSHDIDSFSTRQKTSPWLISEEEKNILKEFVIPYWRGKDLWSKANKLIPKHIKDLESNLIYVIQNEVFHGIGHLVHGLKTGMNEGLLERKRKAQQYLNELDLTNPENLKKSLFYRAVSTVCDAVITFSKRHAELAKRLAEEEGDEKRKLELLKIAEICERVPAYPPRNFYEAIQSVWMIYLGGCIESGGLAQSVGRIDQFLYPYYKKDLENKAITPYFARELIECFFVKLNETTLLFPELAASGASNAGGLFQNVAIGGMDKDGNDTTNELTHLCLEAFEHLKCVSPHLSVRIHKNTPKDFLLKACNAAKTASFGFFGDETIIEEMLNKGYPLEEARCYAPVGCVESTGEGDTFGSTGACFLNLLAPVILALYNGRLPNSKKLLTIKTGDSTKFSTFNEFLEAFDKQLRCLAKFIVQGLNAYDIVHAEYMPTPFTSANVKDCLETGLDVTQGGAKYNFTGTLGVGIGNAANSLAGIKKAVFEDKIVTMEELLKILKHNFRKNEHIRQYLINKVPKYGNDDEYADSLANFVVNKYHEAFKGYKNLRGGNYSTSLQSTTAHIFMGIFLPASPDGRKAEKALSDACSPTNATEKNGPTGVFNSVAKLDLEKIYNGIVLNMILSPSLVEGEGLDKFAEMIKTYFELGGSHVQFNVLNVDMLKDAQEHPEKYPTLTIRIAGYNVLFTELDRVVQNDVIRRTEHCTF